MDHDREFQLSPLQCTRDESPGKLVRSKTAEHSEVEGFGLRSQNLIYYMFWKAVRRLLCLQRKHDQSRSGENAYLMRENASECTNLCIYSSAAGEINELGEGLTACKDIIHHSNVLEKHGLVIVEQTGTTNSTTMYNNIEIRVWGEKISHRRGIEQVKFCRGDGEYLNKRGIDVCKKNSSD